MWATMRLALVVLVLGVLVGCAGSPPAAPDGPPRGSAPAPPASGQAASADNPFLAQAGEPVKSLKVATCAVSGGFVHLYTALEGNLFQKYGLHVDHVTIRGSSAALAAMTSGEIHFLYCAADATIPGLASGVDVKLVAAPLVGLPYVLITRPDVRTVADLKGKSLGIPRVGDLADRLSRVLLERHGLVANRDVELRPVGGSQPERYHAMIANIVQGNVVTPPLDAQARKEGMNVVYDLGDLGLPFVYSSVHASSALIRDNPQLVQRFVAAMAEALHLTEKNPELARQALRKTLELEDREALDSAYHAYAEKIVNRRMTIPFDAVNEAIEDARESGTQVTVRGAEDIAVNTFAEELERTRFLSALWGAELPPR